MGVNCFNALKIQIRIEALLKLPKGYAYNQCISLLYHMFFHHCQKMGVVDIMEIDQASSPVSSSRNSIPRSNMSVLYCSTLIPVKAKIDSWLLQKTLLPLKLS